MAVELAIEMGRLPEVIDGWDKLGEQVEKTGEKARSSRGELDIGGTEISAHLATHAFRELGVTTKE